jgi:hypothetical protein
MVLTHENYNIKLVVEIKIQFYKSNHFEMNCFNTFDTVILGMGPG